MYICWNHWLFLNFGSYHPLPLEHHTGPERERVGEGAHFWTDSARDIDSLSGLADPPIVSSSPLQVFPSSSSRKPSSQLHTELPSVLVHIWPHSAKPNTHSSISGRMREKTTATEIFRVFQSSPHYTTKKIECKTFWGEKFRRDFLMPFCKVSLTNWSRFYSWPRTIYNEILSYPSELSLEVPATCV